MALPVRPLRLLFPALAILLVAAFALPAQGGTAAAPEVTDPADDAGLPPLDIAAAWFDANGTHLQVHVQRGSDTAPTAVRCAQGVCAGAGVSLRVVFTVLRADGTPAPTLDDYATSYVLVRLGPDDPAVAPSAATGYYNGDGDGTLEEALNATVDGANVTVAVPLSSAVLNLAGGAAGARIMGPYALSYILTCDPQNDCGSVSPPADQLSSFWDRAPDNGTGADYWFPAAAGADAGNGTASDAPASASTVTVVQTQTQTVTRTETQEQTETVTFTPAAAETHAKPLPAAGILAAAGIVALAAVRRRLA